jgi:hypothetical protein
LTLSSWHRAKSHDKEQGKRLKNKGEFYLDLTKGFKKDHKSDRMYLLNLKMAYQLPIFLFCNLLSSEN